MTSSQVRALRKKSGLTQRKFAARLGVSLRTVQGWEGGRRPSRAAATFMKEVGSTLVAKS